MEAVNAGEVGPQDEVGRVSMIHAAMVVRDHSESPSALGFLLHLAPSSLRAAPGSPGRIVRKGLNPTPEDDDVITDPAELTRRAASVESGVFDPGAVLC